MELTIDIEKLLLRADGPRALREKIGVVRYVVLFVQKVAVPLVRRGVVSMSPDWRHI